MGIQDADEFDLRLFRRFDGGEVYFVDRESRPSILILERLQQQQAQPIEPASRRTVLEFDTERDRAIYCRRRGWF